MARCHRIPIPRFRVPPSGCSRQERLSMHTCQNTDLATEFEPTSGIEQGIDTGCPSERLATHDLKVLVVRTLNGQRPPRPCDSAVPVWVGRDERNSRRPCVLHRTLLDEQHSDTWIFAQPRCQDASSCSPCKLSCQACACEVAGR